MLFKIQLQKYIYFADITPIIISLFQSFCIFAIEWRNISKDIWIEYRGGYVFLYLAGIVAIFCLGSSDAKSACQIMAIMLEE